MTARPLALAQVGALLVESAEGAAFREGAELGLDQALEGLAALDLDAGLASLRAILGLELVLRDRGSAHAADMLNAAIRRSPTAVRLLIEIDQRRAQTVATASRLLDNEGIHQAPRVDAPPPAGAIKAGSLGGDDRDRRRAMARR